MKISNDLPAPELDPQNGRVQDVQKTNRTEANGPGPTGGGDSIQISEKGQLLSRLSSRVDDVPVAGSARLDALQQAVADGSYAFGPDVVANGILSGLSRNPGGI